MKRSLLALAVLTAFAGAASAQSSVTIGGKLDLGVGKSIGTANKGVQDAAGSRLNFAGREDLGGGTAAVFGLEHRLTPDSGASASTTFWNGYSWVGLTGGFGTVRLGRDYTSAFANVQNQIDPWGGDTVAALRPMVLTGNGWPDDKTAVAKVRAANVVKYFNTMGGLSASFDISEADGGVNKPWSGSVTYAAGPVWLGFSHENPGGKNDKLSTLGGRFAMGPAVLRAGASFGTDNAKAKVKSYVIGANIRMGAGDVKVGYGTLKVANKTIVGKLGLGYHYDLSKRTKLYADFARDGKAKTEKTGFDFGMQHNF